MSAELNNGAERDPVESEVLSALVKEMIADPSVIDRKLAEFAKLYVRREIPARIISDLMDMLRDHPEYQGSGPVADGYVFLRDVEIAQEGARSRQLLEESIRDKFAHLSDDALMNRMNHAPDFGYDDEEVELTRRLKIGGVAWRWTQINGRDRVEVYRPGDES